MSITATELKKNLGKYLALSSKEDIYITRNGTVVAKLSNPFQDRVDMAKSLFGILLLTLPWNRPVRKGWIRYEGVNRHLYHN